MKCPTGSKTKPDSKFSPWDMEMAHINFDAACGHGALAAALGVDVCRVMQFFEEGGWVNFPQMESAIRAAGLLPMKASGWVGGSRPAVTLIQFTGPWMAEGVPVAARCRHRHWIATSDDLIWDCNTQKWQTRPEWIAEIPPLLMPRRGDGWEVFRSLTW